MKLIDGLVGAWRGFRAATGGVSDLRHPTAWLQDSLIGPRTTAGVAVTPSSSLTVSAYFRAIALVSADIAKMPVRVVRVQGESRQPIEGHAIARLLHRRPNSEMTSFSFRETLNARAMSVGNAVNWIARDSRGAPGEIWPIEPGEIRLDVDTRLPLGDPLRVTYEWNNLPGSGRTTILMMDDVLHIKGMGNGLWGYSVAQFAARTLGESIAQGEHAGGFYGNAARPGGVLMTDQTLKPEARDNLRRSFEALYRGADNAYKTMLLEAGAKWSPITMPMEDAQFLESRKFTVTEIARWFGIPPHKLGDLEHATFSNIEHQSIEYVQDAVVPWACRWESESWVKLLGPRSGNLEVDFDETALIRGDSKQVAERVRESISTGAMTPNEGRIELGMNPVSKKGMDEFYIQGAMATVETIADPPEPPPAQPPVAAEDPDDPDEPEEPEDEGGEDPPASNGAQEAAIVGLFDRAGAKVSRRETKAVGSASKKDHGEFVSWANGWYPSHRDAIRSEFEGLMRLYPDPDWGAFNDWADEWVAAEMRAVSWHHGEGSLVEWLADEEEARGQAIASRLRAIAQGVSDE